MQLINLKPLFICKNSAYSILRAMHIFADNIDYNKISTSETSKVSTIDGFTALICATLFNTCIVFVYY